MKNTKAFTLVELIVVVTILAILSTIGFVSYSGYLAGVRDTNRIAQLKAIGDALHLYSTNKSLPIPDDKVDIKINSKNVSYQGYVGKDVIETVGYTAEGLDPKDKTYFSYYLTKNKKYFQLMAFLEEEQGLALNLKTNTKVNAEIDYESRYPRVEGDKLGILTGTGADLNKPINELGITELNIDSTIENYNSVLDNGSILSGNSVKLHHLENTLDTGGVGSSCNVLLNKDSSLKGKDGVYIVNPGNDAFPVYCDMTTDGGGWSLVMRGSGLNFTGWNTIGNLNIENGIGVGDTFKLSDANINKMISGVYKIQKDNELVYPIVYVSSSCKYNHLTPATGSCMVSWDNISLTKGMAQGIYFDDGKGISIDKNDGSGHIITSYTAPSPGCWTTLRPEAPLEVYNCHTAESDFSMWVK